MSGWVDGVGRAKRRVALVPATALLSVLLMGGCSASRGPAGWAGAPPPNGHFIWPTSGEISSPFGPRGASNHDGIDIAAPEGTPIRAAASGWVLYAGVLRGYGRVVILGHDYGLTSVYAHSRDVYVRVGTRVQRGSVIASVGRTGRATGPNLHFEIRRANVAADPLHYLPQRLPVLAEARRLPIGG